MELLRDVEPLLEEIPSLLEGAGFPDSSKLLRGQKRILTVQEALSLCSCLDLAASIIAVGPQIGEEVQDLLYWTKGAVLSGADGDIDLFSDCLHMAQRSLREVQAQFSVH